jgi:hypothetical protein
MIVVSRVLMGVSFLEGGTGLVKLTSVATEGFRQLNHAFDKAVAGLDDPIERLNACGKAYVSTAVEYPGHFGVMCGNELINKDDESFASASVGAYEHLLAAIVDIRDAINPDLDVESAATMTWSAVHGLAVLSSGLQTVADKTDTKTAPLLDLIDQLATMLINGLAAR